MNILVIAHYQDDGSPYVSFVHNQVTEFIKQGHSVNVIVPTVFGKGYKYLKTRTHIVIDDVPIWYVDCPSFSNYGKYGINNLFGYKVVDSFVKKMIKEYSIDIIHAHTIGFDGYIAVRLKEKYHIPAVITTHGSDTIAEINLGKERYLVEICKKADCIVAVSSKLKNLLLGICSSLEICVIMNGFHALPPKPAIKEPYTLLQVGGLIKQKNTDLTIRAFEKILKKYPQAKLEIIGLGPEEAKLKQLCKDLHIENFVTFYGYLANEKVLEHMAKSQVFIMPSINEGFGIVYIEAMSQKCVVVGTRGEGIEDVIRNEENGFLIDPQNSESLVNVVTKCLSSSSYCDEIAYRGFETAKKLTWKSNAQSYIQLFDKIISV
jgi:glycosyltransferase involved in cell wall biosynthesis